MGRFVQKFEPYLRVIAECILFSIIFTILMWVCHTVGLVKTIDWTTTLGAILGWGGYKLISRILSKRSPK